MSLKKLAAAALMILSTLGCQTALKQPVSPAAEVKGIDNALSSTVILYDLTDRLVCAGTRVSPTEIVTAFHCVVAGALSDKEAEEIEKNDPLYENQRPETFKGRDILFATYGDIMGAGYDGVIHGKLAYVDRMDFKHDVAVLTTLPSSQASVRLKDHDLGVGEPVFSVGHPYGLEFSFARGYISNQCRWLDSKTCWTQVDISIWGGSSGGGLFDAEGNLAGVASMRINATYAFFVNLDATARLVKTPSL